MGGCAVVELRSDRMQAPMAAEGFGAVSAPTIPRLARTPGAIEMRGLADPANAGMHLRWGVPRFQGRVGFVTYPRDPPAAPRRRGIASSATRAGPGGRRGSARIAVVP